jgi:hypothetical protein
VTLNYRWSGTRMPAGITMAKPFSYWSDKALDEKARNDIERGRFEQTPGWIGKTQPGDYDYDRYERSWRRHKQYQSAKRK